MESLGACSFTRKWRVCGGNWWRRCGPFSMWESLHVWIAGWQQLLQRKSLFYRNGNLFPPGFNQDKSSLNPIQTHLIKPALCVLWSRGRQITSVACHHFLLDPCHFFFSAYTELWGKIFSRNQELPVTWWSWWDESWSSNWWRKKYCMGEILWPQEVVMKVTIQEAVPIIQQMIHVLLCFCFFARHSVR